MRLSRIWLPRPPLEFPTLTDPVLVHVPTDPLSMVWTTRKAVPGNPRMLILDSLLSSSPNFLGQSVGVPTRLRLRPSSPPPVGCPSGGPGLVALGVVSGGLLRLGVFAGGAGPVLGLLGGGPPFLLGAAFAAGAAGPGGVVLFVLVMTRCSLPTSRAQ